MISITITKLDLILSVPLTIILEGGLVAVIRDRSIISHLSTSIVYICDMLLFYLFIYLFMYVCMNVLEGHVGYGVNFLIHIRRKPKNPFSSHQGNIVISGSLKHKSLTESSSIYTIWGIPFWHVFYNPCRINVFTTFKTWASITS